MPSTPLHSAIGLPRDEVGNCRQFAQLLAGEARRRGARFEFGQQVLALKAGSRPVVVRWLAMRASGPLPRPGDSEFDAVVVCAGPQANALLKPLGCKLPIIAGARLFGHRTVAAP